MDRKIAYFPWRRWFQFRLATLITVTSIVAILLGSLENARRRTEIDAAVCQWITERRGEVQIQKHWASTLSGRIYGRYAGVFDSVVKADMTRSGPFCNPSSRLAAANATATQERLVEAQQNGRFDFAPLGELENLECLDLGFTSATASELAFLDDLHKLTTLHLVGAQIGDAGLAHLVEKHPNLQVLGLSSTNITNEGLRHLAWLSELTSLDLNCPHITSDGLVHIRHLDRLEHLYLPPDTTNEGLSHLQELVNLRTLEIRASDVTDAGLINLCQLTKLEVLRLKPTKVGDLGLLQLSHLTNLRELELSGGYPTPITDNGLVHLAGLIKLERLELMHRNITDEGLEQLAGLQNLRLLDVRDTQVSAAGAKALEERLPLATVLYR